MKQPKAFDDSLAECARCGDAISTCWGTCFAFDGKVLCFECATALGGRYNVWSDGWTTAPDVKRIEHDGASCRATLARGADFVGAALTGDLPEPSGSLSRLRPHWDIYTTTGTQLA